MPASPIRTLKLQQLPPKLARFCLSCQKFIEDDLRENIQNAKIIIAFSGGADSLALLTIFHFLTSMLSCKLIVAHLQHMLRPEAIKEAKWCNEFCSQLGIPFIQKDLSVAKLAEDQHIGIEEAARLARYAFLEECRQTEEAQWIFTGHQLDDLGEDVLMRLLRGTGWPALSGMSAKDPARHLLRPLLTFSRDELEHFLTELGLSWQNDSSNTCMDFLRNRIRATLLPVMKKENPGFLKNIASLRHLGSLDADFLSTVCPTVEECTAPPAHLRIEAATHQMYTPCGMYRELHPAIRLRFFKKMVELIGPGQPLLASLSALNRACEGNKFPKVIQFPGRKFASVFNEGIVWWVAE